jgi:hypothetical protein
MPDKTNPNVRKIRLALARMEKAKAARAAAEQDRNDGVLALLGEGWSVPRIAAEFEGEPGMSSHNVQLISRMRRGG